MQNDHIKLFIYMFSQYLFCSTHMSENFFSSLLNFMLSKKNFHFQKKKTEKKIFFLFIFREIFLEPLSEFKFQFNAVFRCELISIEKSIFLHRLIPHFSFFPFSIHSQNLFLVSYFLNKKKVIAVLYF